MSRLRCIALTNDGPVLPTFLLVHYSPNEREWDIKQIEIWADPQHTKLLADDVQIKDLPASAQESIYEHLNEEVAYKARRVEGLRKLLADLRDDTDAACAAREYLKAEPTV